MDTALAAEVFKDTPFTVVSEQFTPESIRNVLAAGPLQVVKSKPHRSVYFLQADEAHPGLYIKFFHPDRFRKRLELIVRPSYGRQECQMASLLKRNKIPVIEPVAYGVCSKGGMPIGSVFISEELNSSVQLTEFWNRNEDSEVRARLLKGYAELIARLHHAGVYLKDFYFDNVLVTGDREQLICTIVDLESAVPFAGYRVAVRLRNVAGAIYSGSNPPLGPADIDLFFKEYYQAMFATEALEPGLSEFTAKANAAYERKQQKRLKS